MNDDNAPLRRGVVFSGCVKPTGFQTETLPAGAAAFSAARAG